MAGWVAGWRWLGPSVCDWRGWAQFLKAHIAVVSLTFQLLLSQGFWLHCFWWVASMRLNFTSSFDLLFSESWHIVDVLCLVVLDPVYLLEDRLLSKWGFLARLQIQDSRQDQEYRCSITYGWSCALSMLLVNDDNVNIHATVDFLLSLQ